MSIFGAAAAKVSTNKDVDVANVPADGISALAWSPTADILAVTSWSNEVRLYEVGPGGQNQGKASYSHEGPVLCADWSKDGTKLFTGGADNAGRMYDLATGQATQIAAHEAPIRCIKYVEVNGQGMVATGSWDKTLKYWDTRTPTAVATVQLPERVYTMDVSGALLVIGTAERHIVIINLNSPTTIFKNIVSPLKMQTRAIACFPDGTGFTIGSIEGRVAVQFVDDAKTSSNYSFKCHRKEIKNSSYKSSTDVFSVNALTFHPLGSCSTAGGDGDGTINVWDLVSRTRIKTFTDLGGTIAAMAFSRSGEYLSYAVSYDWSKGHAHNTPNLPNAVKIHVCLPEEVRPRPKK